ncbi:hypothetical protein cym2001_47640 [Pseudomonas sp. CYM-20-01]|nr:hypothetical protein cym2001_47640 [Pseudomonas sp. CYM-20-01]
MVEFDGQLGRRSGEADEQGEEGKDGFQERARCRVAMLLTIPQICTQKDSPCRTAMRNVLAGAAKSCKPGAVSARNVGVEVSPNNLGQIGQDQNQCGGEKNESRLTYFRMFEHG